MLFKSFWRRCDKARDAESTADPAVSGAAEQIFIARLTHTSEYHLERLEKLLELRFQKHFGTLDDARLRDLIHFASRIQDADIQRELLLFYLNCPLSIQAYLRSGDIVDESHLLHRAPRPWL